MNPAWLVAAIIDWLWIAFAYSLVFWSLWLIPAAVLIIGNRQHALGLLGHDGAHRSVCPRNRRCNDLFTNLFTFYPLGISLTQYRVFHWAHHRNTNNEHDPELILKATRPNPITAPVTRSKIVRHAIMDLLGFGLPHIVHFILHIRPRKLTEYGPIIALVITSMTLVATGFGIIPALWFASTCTSFWCFFRIRVWHEHVGLGEGETYQWNKPYWLIRSIFMPHNAWLHYEHHQSPCIPFNQLGK